MVNNELDMNYFDFMNMGNDSPKNDTVFYKEHFEWSLDKKVSNTKGKVSTTGNKGKKSGIRNANYDRRSSEQSGHSMSFERASNAFYDKNHMCFPDEANSTAEESRYLLIGKLPKTQNKNECVTIVSFTYRNNNFRIISAREASPEEIKDSQYKNEAINDTQKSNEAIHRLHMRFKGGRS